jgi:hypothetical protein
MPNKNDLRGLREQIKNNPDLFPGFPNHFFWTNSGTTESSNKTMNFRTLTEDKARREGGTAYILPIRDISL